MHKVLMTLSRWMAYLGGAMLIALIVLTCLSVAGRLLNGWLLSDAVQSVAPGAAQWLVGIGVGAIFGDVELTEAGVAFAIFAFLPICHLTNGHAAVDVFTRGLPARANRALGAVIEVVFAAVMILIAVQLTNGMLSKMRSGQTTFLIEFPIWWAYALALTGAVLAAVVAAYLAVIRVLEFVRNRDLLPHQAGADL